MLILAPIVLDMYVALTMPSKIKAVAAVCRNTVVVMHNVGPTLVDSWINNTNGRNMIISKIQLGHVS